MKDDTIVGRHYTTGEAIRISWQAGVITAVESIGASASDNAAMHWLAPALFDVQVNGYAGIDFQQDNLSIDELLAAARGLRRDGCGRFFFTLVTATWPLLLERLRHARKLRASSEELRAAIAGWHIEGPFLSDQPGYCGAHDASVMLDPTPDRIRELRQAAGEDPLLLTIAPERPGAIDAIRLARSLGITISLGHTNASAEVLEAAIAAGATGFTHLANGCPRELDRHDNILWRVCDTAQLTPSFIPDGIHVSPRPFRLLHRLLGGDRMFYTTDAMAAAGAPPGRYRLGTVEVEVGSDQIVRQPGKTNFAGSALRPSQAVFRAAEMLSCPWQDCWRRLSEAPARFVGLQNSLSVSAPMNVCAIEVGNAGELRDLRFPGE